MSETYLCSVCREPTERSYGVRYIVLTCPACGRHGRHVHASLVPLLDRVPESERSDDWEDRPLDERLLEALERGDISLGDTAV
ncbi:hypothetical protein C2R22_03810 [Salinigranum rubrum]|uniref:Small CPxCG-related zinc finger protein n=1 Tax=Salinigranum rubrum TaxID=755307 RepID=A0A2I8VG49_9EURY|nr:hypothetical protein [Salinigranum rubrum]AUV80890.1 hypothetical protein C2R22_03810 [Salinigranum rubrum]